MLKDKDESKVNKSHNSNTTAQRNRPKTLRFLLSCAIEDPTGDVFELRCEAGKSLSQFKQVAVLESVDLVDFVANQAVNLCKVALESLSRGTEHRVILCSLCSHRSQEDLATVNAWCAFVVYMMMESA